MNRAMLRDPALPVKGRCTDHDAPMACSRPVIARMARVQVTFVDDLKVFRLKPAGQSRVNVCVKCHYFRDPSSIRRVKV